MPLLAIKAAALVVATGAAVVGGKAEFHGATQTTNEQHVTVVKVYIARPGDTLGKIAAEFCGNPEAYPSLARASGIANPNMIYVGQRIILACFRAAPSGPPAASGGSAITSGRAPTGSSYAAGSANIPATNQIYSYAGLYRLWIAAGGSPSRAAVAACIAARESSGKPWAISPTNDWGLWQIHAGGSYMLIPFANAQRAIAMSRNGTDWSQWTTHSKCGV
jgi:LysM repeat protein